MKFMNEKLLLIFITLLLPLCTEGAERNSPARQAKVAGQPQQERVLGELKLGDPGSRVKKKLPGLKSSDQPGVSVARNWRVWIDADTKTLKAVSYEERSGVREGFSYPKTGGGVGVNSTLKDVDAAYGPPERSFAGKSPFVLRNGELAYIFAYPSKGLWIVLTNQTPYSGAYNWRVTSITIGDTGMIEQLLAGVYAYATTPVLPKKKADIAALYRKKFGSEKELEVHDAYQYNLLSAYFEHVRSLGPYVITPEMVVPKDEHQVKKLLAELATGTPLSQKLEARAKKQTMDAYGVSAEDLDGIAKNVQKFRVLLFQRNLATNDPEAVQSLQLPQGQCK
jgi:hypothetical protein